MNLALRGPALLPRADERRLDYLPDAVIDVDEEGRVREVGPAAAGSRVPLTHPGCVWLPGFVDTHLHYPQTRILGSASGPLLEWLDGAVFPEEARFADAGYARAVAREFCRHALRQGTTAVSVFGSPHPEATAILFDEMARAGLRGQAGLTLMDRGAPPANLLAAGPAVEAAADLARRWHGRDDDRLRFCVTPRFALSCSPELLAAAGQLAADLDLPVQTHLSENVDEIAATARAFPEAPDYLGVYEQAGLVRPGAVFAHCVHLDDGGWRRLAAAGAGVAHCPDSNFFLGSGVMPLARGLRHGVAVGLGTDVGAGRSFSLRRIAAAAYDASLLAGEAVEPEAILWLATAGGAAVLGLGDRVGRIAAGLEADLVALPIPELASGDLDPADPGAKRRIVDRLCFDRDAGPARATYVRGRLAWLDG